MRLFQQIAESEVQAETETEYGYSAELFAAADEHDFLQRIDNIVKRLGFTHLAFLLATSGFFRRMSNAVLFKKRHKASSAIQRDGIRK